MRRRPHAEKVSHELDLAGDWWCAWQTWKDGTPRIDTHPLKVHQQGELRLWDNEALADWYHSTDAAVRSKGTIYLALHPHGTHA